MKNYSSKSKFILILNTTNSLTSAEKIAKTLVHEKLAACVNILPKIKSIYSWKKKICKEEEFLLIIKTSLSLYSKVEKRILEIHPYETPEIIQISIQKGNKSYLNWIFTETSQQL